MRRTMLIIIAYTPTRLIVGASSRQRMGGSGEMLIFYNSGCTYVVILVYIVSSLYIVLVMRV